MTNTEIFLIIITGGFISFAIAFLCTSIVVIKRERRAKSHTLLPKITPKTHIHSSLPREAQRDTCDINQTLALTTSTRSKPANLHLDKSNEYQSLIREKMQNDVSVFNALISTTDENFSKKSQQKVRLKYYSEICKKRNIPMIEDVVKTKKQLYKHIRHLQIMAKLGKGAIVILQLDLDRNDGQNPNCFEDIADNMMEELSQEKVSH